MQAGLIPIEVVASTLQGEIICRMLAEQGIPCELSDEADADTGGPSFGPLGSVQVLVLEEHAANAKRLLLDYYAGHIPTASES